MQQLTYFCGRLGKLLITKGVVIFGVWCFLDFLKKFQIFLFFLDFFLKFFNFFGNLRGGTVFLPKNQNVFSPKIHKMFFQTFLSHNIFLFNFPYGCFSLPQIIPFFFQIKKGKPKNRFTPIYRNQI